MYHLKSCVWELTRACGFSCKHCGSSGGVPRENELSTQECLRVADELAEIGCKRVSLIGGEIFMRRDWDAIAHRLIGRGVAAAIITNGFRLSEERMKRIRELCIESVAVSIDGTRTLHDQYRQKGSFEQALQTARSLAEHRIPVSVITTLNSENIHCLEGLYRIFLDVPISAWQLQACSPMGNVSRSGLAWEFDHAAVIDFVSSHAFAAPFTLGIADNIGYFTEQEGFLRGNLNGRGIFPGCQAGLSAVAIDSVGNVRGCESMYSDAFVEGNLREHSLAEIWNNPEAFAYNRGFMPELLTGKCRSCRFGAVCAGGCRSYNYFTHKKLYESVYCVSGARRRSDHGGE